MIILTYHIFYLITKFWRKTASRQNFLSFSLRFSFQHLEIHYTPFQMAGPFVFSADIAKIYRQGKIHPDSRAFQHILWRFEDSEKLSSKLFNNFVALSQSLFYQPHVFSNCLRNFPSNFLRLVDAWRLIFIWMICWQVPNLLQIFLDFANK